MKKTFTFKELKSILKESSIENDFPKDKLITSDMIYSLLLKNPSFQSYMDRLASKIAMRIAENIVFDTNINWDYDNESSYVVDRIKEIAKREIEKLQKIGYYLGKDWKRKVFHD